MKVEIQLHATLRREEAAEKGKATVIDLPTNSTVRDLWNLLEIDLDPDHLLFVRNGKTSDLGHNLEDGDTLNIMTGLAGG